MFLTFKLLSNDMTQSWLGLSASHNSFFISQHGIVYRLVFAIDIWHTEAQVHRKWCIYAMTEEGQQATLETKRASVAEVGEGLCLNTGAYWTLEEDGISNWLKWGVSQKVRK